MPTSEARSAKGLAELPYRPCVGIMVLNRDGLVWAGHRVSRSPHDPEGQDRWWQMPQGGIDAREDPAAAAVRELEEETGIRSVEIVAESPGWYSYDLPVELRPKAWGGRYRGQRQKWFAVRFTGAEDEIALVRPGHPQEFDRWRWAGIDELVGLIVPFKRAVYEQVVGDFAALARPRSQP